MKKSPMFCVACACGLGLASSGVAWAVPITITSNWLYTEAFDDAAVTPTHSGSVDDYTLETIPLTETLTTTDGSSSSTMDINYAIDSTSATLAVDISHSIDNADGLSTDGCCDSAGSANNNLYFTANSDATYLISGLYNMSGPTGTRTLLNVHLYDLTAGGVFLFRDVSLSFTTADETFVAGVAGDGDFSNANEGALTGNLIAGHEYEFYFGTGITSSGIGPSETFIAATATGNVTLGISAIPVPASLWLLGSGLLGLIGIAKRKAA